MEVLTESGTDMRNRVQPLSVSRFEARTDREIEEMKREIYAVLSHYPVTLPD